MTAPFSVFTVRAGNALSRTQPRYVMKCDDDTFVRLDSIITEVNKVQSGRSFYIGNINIHHRPLRHGKWAVTYEVKHMYFV